MSGSEETGCAEHLGPFIAFDTLRRERHQQNNIEASGAAGSLTRQPFLVLTGDKNSSELTDHLQRHHLDYVELEVYRTCPRTDIQPRLTHLLRDIAASRSSTEGKHTVITVWFACFSPSSAEAVLNAIPTPTIRSDLAASHSWIHDLTVELEARYHVDIQIRMAAIGKTTRNYLLKQGFEGVVQAEKPNADCLARAITDE